MLEPGKRAMTIQLTPSAEVAGFVFPGDHVDVILTHSFSRKDMSQLSERRISETVLTDVRILALDQKSDNQSADPKVAQLATLEVSPKQAEKLALAADIVGAPGSGGSHGGTISLVLRSLAMDETTPTLMPIKARRGTATSVQPYPTVNGDDGLMQRVHIMRGKDAADSTFRTTQIGRHNDQTPSFFSPSACASARRRWRLRHRC